MTLNRSSAPVASPQLARLPHLRVCPPVELPAAQPVAQSVRQPGAPTPPRVRPDVFSADDLALISLFADGLCIEAIARRLDLSDRTIRRRSRALCDRIGVVSTIQVVAWAARRHLI